MKITKIQINEQELIDKYKELNSCNKVAKYFNCSKSTITKRLKELNIDLSVNKHESPKRFLISDEEIKEMYLSGKSLYDIAKVAQTTKGLMSLRKRLNELGVDTSRNMKKYGNKIHESCKKYTLNENIFDYIDSEEKAYWLGFLMADGYNHENKTSVALRIQSSDIEHLEKYRTFLQTNSPIYTFKRKTRKNNLIREYCEVNICSPHFSKALANVGCIQNKTYNLIFPNINPELYNHFIRGYFDGDGCISITGKPTKKDNIGSRIMFNIVGKLDVIEKIQDIICENANVSKTKIRHRNDSFAQRISWSGKNVCRRILEYLYKDATVYLERKHNKYLILSNSAE